MASTTEKGEKLAKNTIILSVGKLCTQIISFFLLPVYTKFLSKEEYGTVDLIATYTSLLMPFVTLQLEQALFRYLIDKRKDKEGIQNIISAIFSMSFLTVIIFSVLYLIISLWIKSNYKLYLWMNLIFASIFAMMLQMARGLGENVGYAMGSFLNVLSTISFNIFFIVYFHMGAYGMILAQCLGAVIGSLYIFGKIKAYQYIHIRMVKKEERKQYIGYSAPLIPNQISWWVLSVSDRTVILWQMGVAFNGIYSAAGKFSTLYSVMFNIFNLSWTEIIAFYFYNENQRKDFSELQDSIVKLLICVYLGIVSIMPFLFPLMINQKYEEAYYQIPILMFSAFFSAMIGLMSAYYIADKNTAVLAKTSMCCAVLNLMMDILFMPFIGLFAASVSNAFAHFLMYIIRYRDIKKYYGVKNSPELFVFFTLSTIIVFCCYYSRNIYLCAICLVCVGMISLLLNKNLIFYGVKLLKKR